MTFRSLLTISRVRTAVLTAVLTAALLSGAQAGSATLLAPSWDTGGPAQSGVIAPGDRFPVLIGSGYEGQVAAPANTLDTATVSVQAASAPAAKPLSSQPAANGSLWDTILAGSGYEGHEARPS